MGPRTHFMAITTGTHLLPGQSPGPSWEDPASHFPGKERGLVLWGPGLQHRSLTHLRRPDNWSYLYEGWVLLYKLSVWARCQECSQSTLTFLHTTFMEHVVQTGKGFDPCVQMPQCLNYRPQLSLCSNQCHLGSPALLTTWT